MARKAMANEAAGVIPWLLKGLQGRETLLIPPAESPGAQQKRPASRAVCFEPSRALLCDGVLAPTQANGSDEHGNAQQRHRGRVRNPLVATRLATRDRVKLM